VVDDEFVHDGQWCFDGGCFLVAGASAGAHRLNFPLDGDNLFGVMTMLTQNDRFCWHAIKNAFREVLKGRWRLSWQLLSRHARINDGRHLKRMAVWGVVFGLGCPLGGELAGALLSHANIIADFVFLSWRMWYELAGAVVMLTLLGALVGHLLDEIAAHNMLLECRVRERTKELQALTEFTEAVLHRIPSAVLVTDGQGRIVWANQSAFRLLREWQLVSDGSTSLLGQGGQTLLVDLSEVWAQLPQVLRDGQVRSFARLAVQTPSGRKTVRCTLAPLRRPDADQAVLILDDITAEEQWQQQLVQSEKLAALGQLSAGLAHELRNPLSAVSTAAYCLAQTLQQNGALSDDAERYLAVIQRNIQRAQRIITSVLAFARPSNADAVFTDLNDLVQAALDIIAKDAERRGIVIKTALKPLPLVRCRPDAVKQAVLNILLNAVQAMPDGGTLSVRTEHEEATNQVRLIIADTGHGIPPENLPRIFDPFFTTKPPGEGTGLGLSIARTAIEADGGLILAESEVGKGSTFTIVLPAENPAPKNAERTDELVAHRR
jgi:signal transduction histidine kinase